MTRADDTRNCKECPPADLGRSRAERAALAVTAITLAAMGAEIGFGLATGSMALLSDGVHMGTHALALLVTAIAYLLTRRHAANQAFSFGTGKIKVLGGYTNAILLGVTAVAMVVESIKRLLDPEAIAFDEAILVAVLGLAVNLVCAAILGSAGDGHAHDHGHGSERHRDHGDGRARGSRDKDSNLRSALVHVITDALTSVIAIASLLLGKYLGWAWLDAAAGMLGAAMILVWAFGLLRDSAAVLVDYGDYGEEIAAIRGKAAAAGASVEDIHIWRYAENERSLLMSLRDSRGRSADELKEALGDLGHYHHVTVEVAE